MLPTPLDWRSRLQQPIASSLLLSLSVHLALLALVQPAPGGSRGGETLVIEARLAPSAPRQVAAVEKSVPEHTVEPVAKPAVAEAKPARSILVSSVPSPAPPLPIPPAPVLPSAAPVAAVTPAPSQAGATPAAAQATRNNASVPVGVGMDSTWYLARQVDQSARTVGSIVPEYPEVARRRNQEGSLKLSVKIDDLGHVHDVQVVEADLPGVFDAAALEAFRDAHFQPAMKDGHPVRYQAYIRVVFKLKD